MSTIQPHALRLAAGLESIFISEEVHATKAQAIGAELRRLHQSEREGWRHANELEQERKRLHAENVALHARVQELGQMARDVNSRRVVELEAQLEAIGGVSPPEGMAGWTKASEKLPPCRDDQDYIGINTAGFAGVFNAVADIAGNVHCMMETAEESVSIMSDLDIWKPFIRPSLASEAKGATG